MIRGVAASLVVAGCLFAVGCRGVGEPAPASPAPITAPAPAPETPAPTDPPTCEAAPQWRHEAIELPPEFAPSLPVGHETLWFSPGMFDPAADDYFTYAFQLDFDDAALDPDAVRTILLAYFEGLMGAVASGKDRTAGPVGVRLDPGPRGHYLATVEMTDEFTTAEEVTVVINLEATGHCLLAFATAKPSEPIAQALHRARACLPCAARTR